MVHPYASPVATVGMHLSANPQVAVMFNVFSLCADVKQPKSARVRPSNIEQRDCSSTVSRNQCTMP